MKAFPPKERQGVYRAILSRRDVRAFRPDPVPSVLLARLLHAAHHGPSVGFMQPWSFIVITDTAVKQRVHAIVTREKERAASDFHGERRDVYRSLKLEGILEAPINLCVTCDPTRFGPGVIGRHTIRETDFFSVCCAIENLWLAARAEGIGVGWVSILCNEELREILAIPQPIVPVAYLCIGYPVGFTDRPLLETIGWAPRLDLAELIHMNVWGEREGMDDLVGHLREGGMLK
jgi:5,6-dimethylbenzimidazole synthase